jgi:hypothetical protein
VIDVSRCFVPVNFGGGLPEGVAGESSLENSAQDLSRGPAETDQYVLVFSTACWRHPPSHTTRVLLCYVCVATATHRQFFGAAREKP